MTGYDFLLYAFVPTGIGPPRFYVMADSDEAAWNAVEDRVMKAIRLSGTDKAGLPWDSYDMEVYIPDQVIEDSLC